MLPFSRSLAGAAPSAFSLARVALSTATGEAASAAAAAAAKPLGPSRDGEVYAWGNNADCLVTADKETSKVVTPILRSDIPVPVVQVAVGNTHAAAVGVDGSLWTWGNHSYFGMGIKGADGKPADKVPVPSRVQALDGQQIVQVACAPDHTVAVSAEGDVYTWGWGGSLVFGQGGLGHGNKVHQPFPGLVEDLAADGHKVVQVAAGAKHTLALTSEKAVLSWGDGEFGRLGNGNSSQSRPQIIDALSDVPCKQVACGENFSMVLSEAGQVFVFGKNDQSQLGLGANLTMDITSMEEFPVHNALLKEPVALIAAGRHHALAVDVKGRVYWWGARQFIEPQELTVLRGHNVVQIAAGDDFSAAVTDKGHVYSWGKGVNRNALGHGSRFGEKQPTLIEALSDAKVTIRQISVGSRCMLAVAGRPHTAPADQRAKVTSN